VGLVFICNVFPLGHKEKYLHHISSQHFMILFSLKHSLNTFCVLILGFKQLMLTELTCRCGMLWILVLSMKLCLLHW